MPHLPRVVRQLLVAHIRALQRIGQPLQRAGRLQQLFGDVRYERVSNLSEPDRLADIVDQHEHQMVADASHRHLQPVRPRRGLCGQAVIGSRGTESVHRHELLRRLSLQVERAPGTVLHHLVHRVKQRRFDQRVITHQAESIGRRIGTDHLVLIVHHDRRQREHRQHQLGGVIQIIGRLVILLTAARAATPRLQRQQAVIAAQRVHDDGLQPVRDEKADSRQCGQRQ